MFSAPGFAELTLDDEDLQRAMLSSFLHHLPAMRKEMLSGVWRGPQAFREAVHRLKGSCQCVAAVRVQALLTAAESQALQMAPAQRHAAAARLEQELDALAALLQPLLEDLARRAAENR